MISKWIWTHELNRRVLLISRGWGDGFSFLKNCLLAYSTVARENSPHDFSSLTIVVICFMSILTNLSSTFDNSTL